MSSSVTMNPDWPVKTLDELINDGVIRLGRGNVISKRDIAANPGNYPVYSSAKNNEGKFGEYGLYMFDEEMITWSVDGGGRLFHRPKHRFSVTNVGGTMRINDCSVLDYRFLFYCLTLLHSQIRFDWVKKAHPSVIRKLYDSIPLPPLAEQKRIFGMLDEAFAAIDTATANTEKNLANARDVFKSHLAMIFTIRGKDWEIKSLGSVCTNLDSKRVPITKKHRKPGDIPYYGASGIVDHVADYIFNEDLLLVSEDGANLLARTYPIAFSISGKTWVNNHAHALRFDRMPSQRFVEYYLNSIDLAPFVSGMAQPKLNQKALNSIPVPFPDVEIQGDTVAVFDALQQECQELRSNCTRKLTLLAELKQSLLQKAFSGELTSMEVAV